VFLALLAATLGATAPGLAQEAPEEPLPAESAPSIESVPSPQKFRFGVEVKFNYRDSKFVEVRNNFPFPESFIPPGQDGVFFRPTSAEPSLEVQNVAFTGAGELTSGVFARVEVHVLDLYNRNPTSSDDRIFVREAWARFGRKAEPLEPARESPFFVLLGQAPRFSKQLTRRLESYGLWGTAVGRFEEPQLQVGGSVGDNVYWRASGASANPLFFRDPNALAGDNGTPERVVGDVHPILESGFPILYDAKASPLSFRGTFGWGAGLGVRAGNPEGTAVDVLGWFFKRKLEDDVPIRGSFYSGDLKLLRGPGEPLPFSGNDKREAGANLQLRASGLRLFAQYVDQDIANLPRKGFEAEVAWVFDLHGLFLLGESPVFNWLQPVVRVSRIDNDFASPVAYPGASEAWDWRKYDLGIRLGIVRNVDLTVEYARHEMIVAGTKRHPDETLVTLRFAY
jgi:hypothetical protein